MATFQISYAQKKCCNCEFEKFYNCLILKFIEHEKQNTEKYLFYMVNEIAFDSLNCILKINLSSSWDFDLFKKFNDQLYYKLDNDLVALSTNAVNVRNIVGFELDTLDAKVISKYEQYFFRKNPNSFYTDDDLGVIIEYNNGKVYSDVGAGLPPMFIFSDHRHIICPD